jgi:periplasmic protein CpxP/Spy
MNQHKQSFVRSGRGWNLKPLSVGGLMLLFASLALVAPVWAGENGHKHDHNPDKQLEKLTKRLGLSEEQQAKIKPLLEQKAQQLDALHQQMKDVRQKTRGQIEAELTPDQVKAFQEHQEKRKERKESRKEKHREKHKKGGHGDEPSHE